mgnify:CR=1 FL=1
MLRMNFEAVDKFWQLIGFLKTDNTLSEDMWTDFYNVDGNKLYAEHHIGKEGIISYRENLEIVFRPSLKNLFHQRILENDEWLNKIYRYKLYEQDFKAFQKTLLKAEYVNKMYEHAYSQLPPSMQTVEKDAVIYFTAMGADAAAQDKNIFLSLHLSFFFDKYKKGAIAGHELHHLLRKEYEFSKPVLEMHKGVTYLLESMLNEGVADLIDKEIVVKHNDDLPPELQWRSILVDQASQVITEIDRALSAADQWDEDNFKTERDFRTLVRNTNGHVPGFFMADIIRRNGYHELLMENISDPFSFMKLYNKAARLDKSKPKIFSDKSIENIKSIEAYYKN